MKKIVAIILALFLALSMAACNTDGATASESQPAEASTNTPAENTDVDSAPPVPEESRIVGFVIPSTDIEIMNIIANYLEENLTVRGVSFQVSGAMFDNSQYISLIENYVTMGADTILVVPMDTDAVKDAALAAEAAGVNIAYISSPPTYGDDISGGIYSDYYDAGYQAGKMACAWAKENYPELDSIPIALTVAESDKDSISRTTGMRDAIEEDEKCYAAYETYNATTTDNGYTFAEEALTFDNSIRVFLNYESDPSIGVDNYIQAYVQSDSNLSLDDFATFSVGYTTTCVSLIDSAKEGKSVVRGLIGYSALEPGEPILEVIEHILDGGETPYWIVEKCYSINSFGYDF